MGYLLGMDAGGTKTLSVIVDGAGEVLGVGRAGCGNFQVCGRRRAKQELDASIRVALADAGLRPDEIAVAFYGISGADREKDFQTVREILVPIHPGGRLFLENDTTIALRAGTRDGIGLGLISGTGTNAIGFNAKGERKQVGGWGSPLMGDYGSAHDLAETAFRMAQRGHDGRGEETLLYERLRVALGLEELVDICERSYHDSFEPLDVAAFAPLVFSVAEEGDPVAIGILERAGREIARAGLAVLRSLFDPGDEVPVVLGGSVFQRGSHPAMIESLRASVWQEYPRARFRILDTDPVVGALLFAADRYFENAPTGFTETLTARYKQIG